MRRPVVTIQESSPAAGRSSVDTPLTTMPCFASHASTSPPLATLNEPDPPIGALAEAFHGTTSQEAHETP